jgi:hypothetical protein
MKTIFDKMIDEAIDLELNVAELYTLFCKLFQQDFDFWWKLVEEEHNHAALLKSMKTICPVIGDFPDNFFPDKLEELTNTNKKILELIKNFKKHPDRKAAFEAAYALEISAGEIHYQSFMMMDKVPDDYEIFQRLNHDDKDHAVRIQNYMIDHVS